MIPNSTVAERQGDLGGEKISMSVDHDSLSHIMDVLTNMYPHPHLAVLREYSTNARDSHIEVGNDAPIEVYCPTKLYPFLRIVDHGAGLSVDDIKDMYSRYGASSKRGTNTQTGMLGIGSKSALAYTSQFSVIGIKNGVKVTVSVSRDEKGGGVMEVVDTVATDEPNGVEVIVPAKTGDFSNEFVKSFFMFWDSGTALIDGESNESVFDTSEKIADNVYLVRKQWFINRDCVVMGGVTYPTTLYDRKNRDIEYVFVAKVDIGSVDPAPSREELRHTAKTTKTVESLTDLIKNSFVSFISQTLNSATTHQEALDIAQKIRMKFGYAAQDAQWNGEVVPINGVEVVGIGLEGYNWKSTKYVTHGTTENPWKPTIDPRYGTPYLITGWEPEDGEIRPSNKVMRKTRRYVSQALNKSASNGFIFVTGDITEWMKALYRMVDIKDIMSWVPPSESKSAPGETTYYVYQYNSDNRVSYMTKDELLALPAGKVAFASTSDYNRGYRSSLRQSETTRPLAEIGYDVGVTHLVMIGANRWVKFTREFPNIPHLRNAIIAEQNKSAVSKNSHALVYASMDYSDTKRLQKIVKHGAEIDDKDLVKYATDLCNSSKDAEKREQERRKFSHALAKVSITDRVAVKQIDAVELAATQAVNAGKSLLDNYPLLRSIAYDAKFGPVVEYINLKFAKDNS